LKVENVCRITKVKLKESFGKS